MSVRKQRDRGAGAEAGLAAEAPAPRCGGAPGGNVSRRYSAAEKLQNVELDAGRDRGAGDGRTLGDDSQPGGTGLDRRGAPVRAPRRGRLVRFHGRGPRRHMDLGQRRTRRRWNRRTRT